MALVNHATGELTVKLVYYGPGLCGKTTNLEKIYANPRLEQKGKLISMATETDRTLFFDFMPLELGSVGGKKLRVQLYTVPGQVFYDGTRKLVLRGADGVVFVADSQTSMRGSNLESLENLRTNLRLNGIDPAKVPLVFQYNKRDLPTADPVEEMNRYLGSGEVPVVESIAINGTGVMQTLRAAVAKIVENLAGGVDPSLAGVEPGAPDLTAGSGVVYATAGMPKLTVMREPDAGEDIEAAVESLEAVPFLATHVDPVAATVPGALPVEAAPVQLPPPIAIPRQEEEFFPPTLPPPAAGPLLGEHDLRILLDDSRAIVRALELALERARDQEKQIAEKLGLRTSC